jgi:hypothetical protein
LAAEDLRIFLNGGKINCALASQQWLLFLALRSLPRGWLIRTIVDLRVDVILVKVRNSATQVDLSGTELILIWFNSLKLPLRNALL